MAGGNTGLGVNARKHEKGVNAVGAAKTHVCVETVANHDSSSLVEVMVGQNGIHHPRVGLATDGIGASAAGKGNCLHDGPGAGELRLLVRKRRVNVGGNEGCLPVKEVL